MSGIMTVQTHQNSNNNLPKHSNTDLSGFNIIYLILFLIICFFVFFSYRTSTFAERQENKRKQKELDLWDWDTDPWSMSILNPRFKYTPFQKIADKLEGYSGGNINLKKYELTKYNIIVSKIFMNINKEGILFALYPKKSYIERREIINDDDDLNELGGYEYPKIKHYKTERKIITLSPITIFEEFPTYEITVPERIYPVYENEWAFIKELKHYTVIKEHTETRTSNTSIVSMLRENIPKLEKMIPEEFEQYYDYELPENIFDI